MSLFGWVDYSWLVGLFISVGRFLVWFCVCGFQIVQFSAKQVFLASARKRLYGGVLGISTFLLLRRRSFVCFPWGSRLFHFCWVCLNGGVVFRKGNRTAPVAMLCYDILLVYRLLVGVGFLYCCEACSFFCVLSFFVAPCPRISRPGLDNEVAHGYLSGGIRDVRTDCSRTLAVLLVTWGPVEP